MRQTNQPERFSACCQRKLCDFWAPLVATFKLSLPCRGPWCWKKKRSCLLRLYKAAFTTNLMLQNLKTRHFPSFSHWDPRRHSCDGDWRIWRRLVPCPRSSPTKLFDGRSPDHGCQSRVSAIWHQQNTANYTTCCHTMGFARLIMCHPPNPDPNRHTILPGIDAAPRFVVNAAWMFPHVHATEKRSHDSRIKNA